MPNLPHAGPIHNVGSSRESSSGRHKGADFFSIWAATSLFLRPPKLASDIEASAAEAVAVLPSGSLAAGINRRDQKSSSPISEGNKSVCATAKGRLVIYVIPSADNRGGKQQTESAAAEGRGGVHQMEPASDFLGAAEATALRTRPDGTALMVRPDGTAREPPGSSPEPISDSKAARSHDQNTQPPQQPEAVESSSQLAASTSVIASTPENSRIAATDGCGVTMSPKTAAGLARFGSQIQVR